MLVPVVCSCGKFILLRARPFDRQPVVYCSVCGKLLTLPSYKAKHDNGTAVVACEEPVP
jgi:hypothetical protein